MKNTFKRRRQLWTLLLTVCSITLLELVSLGFTDSSDCLVNSIGSTQVFAASQTNSNTPNSDVRAQDISLEKEYIVVLDPGHDSLHPGAEEYGYYEEQMNFKIALYCKNELERNPKIKVYLTHDTLACPFPDEEEAKACNKLRCEYAASVGADIYVSLHINSNPARYVRGIEIYYPNRNYKIAYNYRGRALTDCIRAELLKLGISDHGIYTKNSTEYKRIDENYYPDGSRADYYNIIRNCKYNDLLGIIVEHGYMSNRNELNTYLNSDYKLKKFGLADATGIAKYLKTLDDNAVAIDNLVIFNEYPSDVEASNDISETISESRLEHLTLIPKSLKELN